MPLLNPPDILPEAMRFLVRVLVSASGRQMPREDLLALVAPTGLVEAMDALGGDAGELFGDDADFRTGGAKIARASLTALRTLELVDLTGETVFLSDSNMHWKSYGDVTANSFAHSLLTAFLARATSSEQIEGGPVGDLRYALNVLYAADDPLWPFVSFEPSRDQQRRPFSAEQQDKLGERSSWAIPNKEQYTTFTRMAPYLGLARAVGSGGLIADASIALQMLLPRGTQGDQGVAEFVATCARALPLLDGGALHSIYEAEESGGHAVLSPAMSLTLLQLEADGVVKLKRLSDVGLRTIRTSSSGDHDQAVSHVTWLPKTKGKGRKL